MKKILLILFLLSFSIVNSQISSYNKGLKKSSIVMSDWFINKGVESFVTKQTPVGYKESYDELKNLLSYYNLNIMEPEVDESLLDTTIESLHDFQSLSNSLKIEWSKINMVWRINSVHQINWMCGNEINLILIQKVE